MFNEIILISNKRISRSTSDFEELLFGRTNAAPGFRLAQDLDHDDAFGRQRRRRLIQILARHGLFI